MRKRENLINPDWLIGRCGCGIYHNNRGNFIEDLEWKSKILVSWDAQLIKEKLKTIDWL